MDPELAKGFQELQAQVIESRSKISNIELRTQLTARDAKHTESILKTFTDADDINTKHYYQPIGRMLVKQEGKEALDLLLKRKKDCEETLKKYQEVKEACLVRVKESENSLRELVNKKLNKSEQPTAQSIDQNKDSINEKSSK